MKRSIILAILIVITVISCKNNKQEKVTTEKIKNSENLIMIEDEKVLEETNNKISKDPVKVKTFTEEDRYFTLDGAYNCRESSGLCRIDIGENKIFYIFNEEIPKELESEQEISFINKNGIDYIKLSKKFPKEVTSSYIYGDSTDVQTDDKILFLAGKTETLDIFLYAYTKGFTSSFTKNSTDELYYCLYKDASSCLTENGKEYSLMNLHNRNLETPWIEGVPGDGIGEGFTLTFNNGGVNPTLLLMNGYVSYDKPYLYEQNNRIKKIKVRGLKSGKEKILDVIDTPHPQTVDISFITEMEDIRVEIAEVYKGTKYDDTCLQYCSTFMETVIPYKSGKAD